MLGTASIMRRAVALVNLEIELIPVIAIKFPTQINKDNEYN
jgi:hypothetical protein